PSPALSGAEENDAIRLGSAALNAFLQANVTGPVLEGTRACEKTFGAAFEKLEASGAVQNPGKGAKSSIQKLRRACLRILDTDGVSVYEYIPHIELFCFARWIFTSDDVDLPSGAEAEGKSLAWIRFRVHLWHFKLVSQPSLGPGSLFTKVGRWTDVTTLQELVERSLEEAETTISQADHNSKVEFLLEKANAQIMLGNDAKAKEALRQATELSGFVFALSGALGKRTRFQETSTSQLVVLAKSNEEANNGDKTSERVVPNALPLNNDTLLERISFNTGGDTVQAESNLPTQLEDLTPENQPQLKAQDQMILLTEATIKDTFSPADSLTAEEVLPFAVRVIDDKPVNWQIYTHALLVRSRIELSRSRTLERAVLQMQAVVDQVVVGTEASKETASTSNEVKDEPDGVPAIEISGVDGAASNQAIANVPKPTSFLPAPKATESASAQIRLQYVNALSSPPRWHLESELAYAWASVGSLISALEIFKRLRLWAEVALCLASSAASSDEDGRGGGGEEKARAIVRWRLFHRTGASATDSDEDLDSFVDADALSYKDFYGPERSPPPPNAPRLYCILGDLENDPAHYQRAWEVSNRRFARAQHSLGEMHLQKKNWESAAEAYRLAVGVNRLNPELWNRLGDIELRLGHFPDAAEAFQRSIGTSNGEQGGEDARTWSNLGTALISWYREVVKENKNSKKIQRILDEDDNTEGTAKNTFIEDLENKPATKRAAELGKPSYKLLQDALTTFKRGAAIANDNWRIWDNVITLAASLIPKPDLDDVVFGTRNVIRIRKSEDALDEKILGLLVREVAKEPAPAGESVHNPPRGSLPQKVCAMFEDEVVPLITTRSEVWALVSRLRAWRRDYAGAVDAAEKGWRAATSGSTGSTLSASGATAQGGAQGGGSWTSTNREGWETVVLRTGELVAAYENWGLEVEEIGERWRGKARSAVRSVMGKGKESWEGSEGWGTLEGLMGDLRL
ncbi:uncharacterized protein BCR38DRAFT_320480, partial [Pseudomassariella vexata]